LKKLFSLEELRVTISRGEIETVSRYGQQFVNVMSFNEKYWWDRFDTVGLL